MAAVALVGTTTELADDLVGGLLSAGPDRLTAGARVHRPFHPLIRGNQTWP